MAPATKTPTVSAKAAATGTAPTEAKLELKTEESKAAPTSQLTQSVREAKYAVGRRVTDPADFAVEARVEDNKDPFAYDPDDDADFWGDPAGNYEEPDTTEELEAPGAEEEEDPVLQRVLRESARAAQLKNYEWSEQIRELTDIPDSFQDLKPMSSKERKELLKDLPETFEKAFPCKGLRSLGEDRKRVRIPSELWFLEKGAPKLHDMLVEELKVMTYLAQEGAEVQGRIEISYSEQYELLLTLIRLHVDTLKMVSAMQVQRALHATQRQTVTKETDPQQLIISTKVKEAELKKVETDLAYELGTGRSIVNLSRTLTRPGLRRGGGSNRRPRFGRQSETRPYNGYPTKSGLVFPRQRGRGRGRGSRGRGKAQSSQN